LVKIIGIRLIQFLAPWKLIKEYKEQIKIAFQENWKNTPDFLDLR
jgi:hypothetical protein